MTRYLAVLLYVVTLSVSAGDRDHCGPNGFSPPAPDWVCNGQPHNQVPEPGSFALVAVGLAALRLVRRKGKA